MSPDRTFGQDGEAGWTAHGPATRLAAATREPSEEWRPTVQTIPSIDLYRELEVDPAATAETIDAAWKSLLKRFHPDVSADTDVALGRVKRLNLAHEWLSDPRKRALYDRSCRSRGVVVLSRPTGPSTGRRGGPAATESPPTRSPARSAAAGGPDANPSGGTSAAQAAQESTGEARQPVVEAPHNPYAEYGHPGRDVAFAGTGRGSPGHRRTAPRVRAPFVPIALVSVLMVVAISSYLASVRTAPPASAGYPGGLVAGSTGLPGAVPTVATPAAEAGSSPAATLASGAPDPRGMAPPDLAAELPSGCRGANVNRAFSFEATVARSPAKVFVVRCDATHSFGPLVYVTSTDGWKLRARGAIRLGYAYQGFSGAISGTSADEFGIAWTRGEGITATVTLYRIANGLQAFWDSSSIGLAWALATFTYEGMPDPAAAGILVVISADLSTGTLNCSTCRDHHLYREFYRWATVAATPGLRRTARQPYGLGPP